MKKTLITLLLLLPLTLFAQVTGSLRGTIIEKESDEPLPYVTIALTPQGSSAPTAGCSTNEDGTFRLNNIKAGSYTVTASFVGYIDESRTINITAGKRDINLGTIYMKSDRKMLQEVVVTEQRSQMSFEIDKRVFTVDQNIATTGGTGPNLKILTVQIQNTAVGIADDRCHSAMAAAVLFVRIRRESNGVLRSNALVMQKPQQEKRSGHGVLIVARTPSVDATVFYIA